MALVLNASDGDGENELRFLNNLIDYLSAISISLEHQDMSEYYNRLLGVTVYSTTFRSFIDESNSFIANALLSSLNSPEIYNAIATYLFDTSISGLLGKNLKSIKILYDVAIGLAHGQQYYMPKYEFNRIKCDFIEIEAEGPMRDENTVKKLISTINHLHRLAFKFPWARKFIITNICQYLITHIDEPFTRKVLSHPNFDSKWGILRNAMNKSHVSDTYDLSGLTLEP